MKKINFIVILFAMLSFSACMMSPKKQEPQGSSGAAAGAISSSPSRPTVGFGPLNQSSEPSSSEAGLTMEGVNSSSNNNYQKTDKNQKLNKELGSYQVTIHGHVEIPQKCDVQAKNLSVQLSDSDAEQTALSSSTLNDKKEYNIISTAHKGWLTASILDASKKQSLYSKQLFAGNNDHFEINFILCLDKDGAGSDKHKKRRKKKTQAKPSADPG